MAQLIPSLCDDLGVGISVHDPDTGVIHSVNERVEALTGHPAAELRGTTMEAYSAADATATSDAFHQQIQATTDGEPQQFAWAVATPSGQVSQLRVRLSTTTLDGEPYVLAEFQDITPEQDRINQLKTQESVLRRFHELASQSAPFEERMASLLEFGRTVMGVEQGFLTSIDGDTQRITIGVGPNDQLQDGATAPFAESYCRYTVEPDRDQPMTVVNAAEDGWENDPAYDRFGLGCYAGSKLVVDGETVGTLCFADRDPTDTPFTELQETFIELLSEWASTELERADREQELRRKDRAIEAAPVGITITNPEQSDNPLIYVNDRYEEMTGYSEADALGRNCRFLQGDATREEPVAEMRQAIDNAESVTVELRNYQQDGQQFWNRVSIAPVTDDEGVLTNFVGFQQDITEDKQQQLELERTSELLEQTQQVANIGGWEYDLRSETLQWTDEVYHIHGKPETYDPTVGAAIEQFHPDDRESLRSAFAELTTDGTPFDLEVRILRDDGTMRWVRTRGTPRYDGDELVAVAGTQQDITERKEFEEELKRSNERLQEFAYILSHDLQEPLRMVSSYVCLLEEELEEQLDDETRQYIDFAVDGAERMRGMIDGLLLYSRVETEGSEHTETDVNTVLSAVEADLELKLAETDSELHVDSLPTIEADEDQLVQLFENLIKNAIEHGGEETTVSVTSTSVPEGVQFAVSDDGPGIPADQQDEIFGLFDKGGDSDGTGIGLAICERIVARHDGEISVESTPGEGATFYVTLPDS
ncbi:hypothetical protein DM826_09025 [Halonotius aquaticus]|uniref:histidine kinase n=1 Tax=Halonotius aquaticus TaxID=2216978 RepID=A0A3A6PMT3_9EURY|nr:PAS domain S-box protein [Halonotius aquaticus]RJX42820.1 hypothetical protein DM826_09025 [Halonotius aquaticus]